MKANQIKVGGVYLAKVSGTITRVRVDSINETDGRSYTTALGTRGRVKATTSYGVTNLKTGRTTTFRSASKFRAEALDQPRAADTMAAAKAKLEAFVPAGETTAPARPPVTPAGDTDFDAGPTNMSPERLKTIQGGYGKPAEGEPVFVVILVSLTAGTEYVGRNADGRFDLYISAADAYRFRGHSGWKSAMSYANQYARPGRAAFVCCESYTTGPC